MKNMPKTVKCLAAMALAAALVSIFVLTRGRGGVICQVEVEQVFYVAQGAVIDGRQVIVYDCELPQEDSYTTVTAEAYFEDGRLTVEANHDWAANETSATGNRVRLIVALPDGTETDDVEAVALKVVDQRGSESVAELGKPLDEHIQTNSVSDEKPGKELSLEQFETSRLENNDHEMDHCFIETYDFSEIIKENQFDLARLISMDKSSADFVASRGNTYYWFSVDLLAYWFSIDLYNQSVLHQREIEIGSFNIFADKFELDGRDYLVFADTGQSAALNLYLYDAVEGRQAASFESDKLPFCVVSPDRETVYISQYIDGRGDTVFSFDGRELKKITQLKSSFKDGYYSGEILTAFGSDDKYIYIQASQMQKNALQDADIIIRQYDPAFNLLDSWKMPDKFDFIAGGERTWANIYAYAHPLEESGLIIDFSQESQKILPAVRSGNDLRAAGRFCGFDYGMTPKEIIFLDDDDNIKVIETQNGIMSSYVSEYLFAWQEDMTVSVMYSNIPNFGEGFTDEEKSQLGRELKMADIDLVHRDEEVIIYLETSNWEYITLQSTDIILWEYKNGSSKQLLSASGIFWNVRVLEDERTVELDIDYDTYTFKY